MAARPYLTTRVVQDSTRANAEVRYVGDCISISLVRAGAGVRSVGLVAGRTQSDCCRGGLWLWATSGGGSPSKGPPRTLEERAHQLTSASLLANLMPGLGFPILPVVPRDSIQLLALDHRNHFRNKHLRHHYVALPFSRRVPAAHPICDPLCLSATYQYPALRSDYRSDYRSTFLLFRVRLSPAGHNQIMPYRNGPHIH